MTAFGEPTTILGAPTTILGEPMTSLGPSSFTIEQSGKNNILIGYAAGALRNHSYYALLNNFITHVFSLYFYSSISIATHLCMVYLDRL
jgi:hypothetical protein